MSTTIIAIAVIIVILWLIYWWQNSSENFDRTVRPSDANKPALVLFKVNWCGHCKKFKSEWKKVPNRIGGIRKRTIDGDRMAKLTAYHNVKSYPTILLLPRGVGNKEGQIVYEGPRKAANLLKWLSYQVGSKPERFSPGNQVYAKNLDLIRSMQWLNNAENRLKTNFPKRNNFSTLKSDVKGAPDNFNPGRAIYPVDLPREVKLPTTTLLPTGGGRRSENMTARPYGNITQDISVGETTYHDRGDLRWGVKPRTMIRYPPGSYYNQQIVKKGYRY